MTNKVDFDLKKKEEATDMRQTDHYYNLIHFPK